MVESDNKPTLTPKEKLLLLKDKLMTRGGKIGLSVTIGMLLIALLMMKACAPAQGSILYGICNAFLEQRFKELASDLTIGYCQYTVFAFIV